MAVTAGTKFSTVIAKDMTDHFDHAFLGRHGGAFSGRRYRRGKNRCGICGKPLSTPDAQAFAPSMLPIIYGVRKQPHRDLA